MISAIIFFFNDTATTEIYTLSLHDALPICWTWGRKGTGTASCVSRAPARCSSTAATRRTSAAGAGSRSEEHTSELQSRQYLVCRLLLEKKNMSQTQDQDDPIDIVNYYNLTT